MEKNTSCKNCKFFEQTYRPRDKVGDCRIKPPMIFSTKSWDISNPQVSENYWCGEWKPGEVTPESLRTSGYQLQCVLAQLAHCADEYNAKEVLITKNIVNDPKAHIKELKDRGFIVVVEGTSIKVSW